MGIVAGKSVSTPYLSAISSMRSGVSESSGRDDLQDPERHVARVPEGVPLPPRLEHKFSSAGKHLLAPKHCPDAPFEYIRVFVLPRVAVYGCGECSRWDEMLDKGEPSA
jgi:hypothetical protein